MKVSDRVIARVWLQCVLSNRCTGNWALERSWVFSKRCQGKFRKRLIYQLEHRKQYYLECQSQWKVWKQGWSWCWKNQRMNWLFFQLRWACRRRNSMSRNWRTQYRLQPFSSWVEYKLRNQWMKSSHYLGQQRFDLSNHQRNHQPQWCFQGTHQDSHSIGE